MLTNRDPAADSLTKSRGKTQKTEEAGLYAADTKAQNLGRTQGKTRITIKYDVGFSNQLFIRGNGAGLNWDRGQLLKNMGRDLWVWEPNASFTQCEFKVLINDRTYEAGANHTLKSGSQIEYTPRF